MSTNRKKKRQDSLENLKKTVALMIAAGATTDTIKNVLAILEGIILVDLEKAKNVLSDLAILLDGKMPKEDRDSVVSCLVITILQLIAEDLEKQNVGHQKKGV